MPLIVWGASLKSIKAHWILPLILPTWIVGCSGSPSEDSLIQTAIAETQVYEDYLALAQEATEKAKPTETPIPIPSPTKTPTPSLPDYCYEDAIPYLDEVDSMIGAIIDSIEIWNRSARGDQEILEQELRIRALVDQAELLTPPSDFNVMHEHFMAYVYGTLNATLGVIDASDERREGSNITYLDEFDLALEAWDDAASNRERECNFSMLSEGSA